ncbi:MAG TPA: YceI family protein, partial [Clostridia bacterium]|nr:YceI family protein [Clostridia bacterium]
LIGGYMEVGSDFPIQPGASAKPGPVEARAEAFITIRGLKSVEKDGQPYSDKMDSIMYEKLLAKTHPRILYYLSELALEKSAQSESAPYVFKSKGNLVVAGVTNQIDMPVQVLPLGEDKLKITGAVAVKMTDFRIEPPAPKWLAGIIKTGDEVKLSFEWLVGRKSPAQTVTSAEASPKNAKAEVRN